MPFNSSAFAVFFSVFLPLFAVAWLAGKRWGTRVTNTLLLVASYVFYGAWDHRFLLLIALSTLVDFVAAMRMHQTEDEGRRRRWLTVSLVTNLGLLFVFKYFGFFVRSMLELGETLGFALSEPTLSIILPVGISFFTFQTMSYTIDVYRRRLEPTNDLLVFATFVAFFPQLVAGPIVRAASLLPQLAEGPRPSIERFFFGLCLAAGGFFLKMAVADNLAVLVDYTYENATSVSYPNLVVGVLFYSFQIYADFNGYSLIAVGIGHMLGFDLGWNFLRPYLSGGFSEFWRRWHISLSTWLRDYLYVSLGGNRTRLYRNLLLTMLLGGLWHGAAWHFVVWGALHGSYLVLERAATRAGLVSSRPSGPARAVRQMGVFVVVTLTWIFFRAESLSAAFAIFRRLGSPSPEDLALGALNMVLAVAVGAAVVGALALFELVTERRPIRDILATNPVASIVAAACLIWATSLLGNGTAQGFIYFQF